MQRCDWAGDDPIYQAYHDTEWGVPEYDSRALWEKLILDGFQAGLSWITILKKRDNFRAAFAGFAPHQTAAWGQADVTPARGGGGGRGARWCDWRVHGRARARTAGREGLPLLAAGFIPSRELFGVASIPDAAYQSVAL